MLGLWCLTPLSAIFQLPCISWRPVLLVEETGIPGENHRTVASHWQILMQWIFLYIARVVVVVIVEQLDLQLLMQSMSITTKAVSSNPVHGEVYSIQYCVIKFVSDLRQFGGFHRVFRFPLPIKLAATKYRVAEILLKVALNIITLTHSFCGDRHWLHK
jgi:hypothetical protein